MIDHPYSDRISDDWLWREKELRDIDALLLKNKNEITLKSGILLVYAHWEGHFKVCASALLEFMSEGVKRKAFAWTDIRPEIRQRLLFCGYRKSSLSGQSHETFISYLNALNDSRYSDTLKARDEIVMIDDNLNATRAEAICRNLGVEYSWCALKKIIIDERLITYRNAIAHGARRLSNGEELDLKDPLIFEMIGEIRTLIRQSKNTFANAISQRVFL